MREGRGGAAGEAQGDEELAILGGEGARSVGGHARVVWLVVFLNANMGLC